MTRKQEPSRTLPPAFQRLATILREIAEAEAKREADKKRPGGGGK